MKTSVLYTQFDGIFFEKTRLSIITILYRETPVTFNRLKRVLDATDGALYTHLQKLNDAGYIIMKKTLTGNRAETLVGLSREGRKRFQHYLKFMEESIREMER